MRGNISGPRCACRTTTLRRAVSLTRVYPGCSTVDAQSSAVSPLDAPSTRRAVPSCIAGCTSAQSGCPPFSRAGFPVVYPIVLPISSLREVHLCAECRSFFTEKREDSAQSALAHPKKRRESPEQCHRTPRHDQRTCYVDDRRSSDGWCTQGCAAGRHTAGCTPPRVYREGYRHCSARLLLCLRERNGTALRVFPAVSRRENGTALRVFSSVFGREC